MRKIFFRLVIPLVFLGATWLYYNNLDSFSCNGPRSTAWVDITSERLEEALNSRKATSSTISNLIQAQQKATTNESSNPFAGAIVFPSELRTAEDKANSRYLNQQKEDTPKCLQDLQEKVVELFYYDWKYYSAASSFDFDNMISYDNKIRNSIDEIQIQLDKIKAQYSK